MSARRKLNGTYLAGCLVVAALVGLATGPGAAFAAALGTLVAADLAAGNIRPGSLKRR